MPKTFTNKVLSFLYHYLSVSFSHSLSCLLLSPLLLCISFFSHPYFFDSIPFFFIFSLVLLLLSLSSFLLFSSFFVISSYTFSILLPPSLLFFSSCNSTNYLYSFNIIKLFSITYFNSLITSSSPISLINPSTFT